MEPVLEEDAEFQRRFDIARMVLERKYRWAKYVLRDLQPIRRAKGTMSVDKYLRLYHGPDADGFTDQEFIAAVWHEVNHILRHHADRLGDIHKPHKMDPKFVNLAADLEINDDLRDQGFTLPQGVFYSDSDVISDRHAELYGRSAEEHFARFVLDRKEEPPSPGQGDGEKQEGDQEDDDTFDPNAPHQGQQGGQDQSQGDSPGSNQPDPDGADKPSDEIPEGDCGSGADGDDRDYEEPEPQPEEQNKLDRDMAKQDEEVVKAVEENDGGLPPGMSQEVFDQAVKRLDIKSKHDWRQTIGVEIRNAMEQRADEAEEYTYRRRSRRAGVSDEFILPGSYRPIPKLGVVVDISGSMDAQKVTATFRELVGILERLAIPSFTAYAWNTVLKGEPVTVQSASDVKRILERRGGGTDMQKGLDYAVERGEEVIVVLTDNETHWEGDAPPGVPTIMCGINRSHSYPVPKWFRVVDVTSDKEDGYDPDDHRY